MAGARQTAARALLRVFADGGYSNIALAPELDAAGLSGQERDFCAALFYGTLERGVTLDAVIAGYSSLPPSRISATVRQLLRLGLYQLIYMPSVPRYAAINETVELARRMGEGGACGFINGVLRAFLRAEMAFPAQKSPQAELAVRYGVPEAIVRLWQKQYGEDTALAILEGSTGAAPVFLRVNTLRTDTAGLSELLEAEGLSPLPVPDMPDALRVTLHGDITLLPSFRQGLWHVQDLSSQRCALALEAQPGMRVLDVCAAPGGKSFTAMEAMGGEGYLLARDLYESRLRLVSEGAARLGLDIAVSAGDAAAFDPSLGKFDRVLCDVPCSGFGVMRRKAEIRYKSLDILDYLAEIQYNILCVSSEYLCGGGRLVYSTCTLNKKENERTVERFLAGAPDFALISADTRLPVPDGGDGFFFAVLERRR